MTKSASPRDLRKALAPLVNSVVPAVARLCLHLSGAAALSPPEVERLTTILRLFVEALDEIPETR